MYKRFTYETIADDVYLITGEPSWLKIEKSEAGSLDCCPISYGG